jgi:CTD small phosphatase-like protein 2
MAKFYDIVVFTAGMKDYADWAVSHFYDNAAEKYISARFYREFAMPCSGFYVKDLSRLGRDLSKTIIIDNTPECFLLQPQNGIQIKNWYRDPEDTALTELSLLLE